MHQAGWYLVFRPNGEIGDGPFDYIESDIEVTEWRRWAYRPPHTPEDAIYHVDGAWTNRSPIRRLEIDGQGKVVARIVIPRTHQFIESMDVNADVGWTVVNGQYTSPPHLAAKLKIRELRTLRDGLLRQFQDDNPQAQPGPELQARLDLIDQEISDLQAQFPTA